MSFVHVQGIHNGTGNVVTNNVAATGAVIGSGNTVVGTVSWGNTGLTTLVSVTDDKLNTYTVKDTVNDFADTQSCASFVLGNITNGPKTLTVLVSTSDPSGAFLTIIWDEYSGAAALTDPTDGHTGQLQSTPGGGTDAVTSGNVSTTTNGDLIYGGTYNTSTGTTPVAGTGFTFRTQDTSGASGITEDEVQGTAGSVATTFTINPGASACTFLIAIKAGSAAPPLQAWGFEPIYSPRDRAPRTALAGSIMRGSDGTEQRLFGWQKAGWEVQPPQPPHPTPEKRGAAVMRGDDGTEQIKLPWQNAGWETQPPQPPHPRPERFGAVVKGDDGSQAAFTAWRNAGWDPPAPPPRRLRFTGNTFPINIENVFAVPQTLSPWGYELQPQALRLQPRTFGALRGGSAFASFTLSPWWGEQDTATYRKVFNKLVIQSTDAVGTFTPPTPAPLLWGHEFEFLYPRRVPRIFDTNNRNIEALYIPTITTVLAWRETPLFQPNHPRFEKAAAILQGDAGNEAPFVFWRNSGWEIQPFQPPRLRWEKAAAAMRGDDGTTAQLIRWTLAGWEIQPFQPGHPRPERAGAIMRGPDGTEFPFIPPVFGNLLLRTIMGWGL